jgi:hypothetical protein
MSRSTTNDSYQWVKFFEHWGIHFIPLMAILAFQSLFFLARMEWPHQLGVVITGFGLQIVGAGLIGYAKFPTYRQGQLLGWGATSVPKDRRTAYRWGWRLFASGVLIALIVLATTPQHPH